jgi:hypothetical protein
MISLTILFFFLNLFSLRIAAVGEHCKEVVSQYVVYPLIRVIHLSTNKMTLNHSWQSVLRICG